MRYDRKLGKHCIVTGHSIVTTGVYYGSMLDTGLYALIGEANELAARGARSGSAMARILIPPEMDRSSIYSIRNHMKKGKDVLAAEGFILECLKISGGVSTGLKAPVALVTAAGEADVGDKQDCKAADEAEAGMDLVLAGWAGLEGMLRIIGERETELKERFAPSFLRQMKECAGELLGFRSIEIANSAGVTFIRQVSEGGIFAALWELSGETELGIEADIKKISVRQETIEVCEHFRLNPYQLASCGSFLMLAKDGNKVADALKWEGVQAAVIGSLTDNHDKIIQNGGEVRYLDRPGPDELMKIF